MEFIWSSCEIDMKFWLIAYEIQMNYLCNKCEMHMKVSYNNSYSTHTKFIRTSCGHVILIHIQPIQSSLELHAKFIWNSYKIKEMIHAKLMWSYG